MRMSPAKTKTEKNARHELVEAVGHTEAQAHLILGWRRQKPGYKLQYVEVDEDVSSTFLGYARETAKQLASDRAETPYDSEWPLGDHEYFALAEDGWPGGDLFEAL